MTAKSFQIISVNIAGKKGEKKSPVNKISLIENHGIRGDAHAGPWHRQVSLLAMEAIEEMRKKGLAVSCGDFAENITTSGVDWPGLPIGAKFSIGDAVFEISQIGKECHNRCEIFQMAGDCIMPRKGVFAKVLKGGEIDTQSTGTIHLG